MLDHIFAAYSLGLFCRPSPPPDPAREVSGNRTANKQTLLTTRPCSSTDPAHDHTLVKTAKQNQTKVVNKKVYYFCVVLSLRKFV
jgi:hypothetical protein